ncbi:MAG: hypothetical protein K8F91_15785 [Candidatus Obscuribacterales bacterium]|nr:hypothetical protein [Candidatus Obscuribacterales bacterium]
MITASIAGLVAGLVLCRFPSSWMLPANVYVRRDALALGACLIGFVAATGGTAVGSNFVADLGSFLYMLSATLFVMQRSNQRPGPKSG